MLGEIPDQPQFQRMDVCQVSPVRKIELVGAVVLIQSCELIGLNGYTQMGAEESRKLCGRSLPAGQSGKTMADNWLLIAPTSQLIKCFSRCNARVFAIESPQEYATFLIGEAHEVLRPAPSTPIQENIG